MSLSNLYFKGCFEQLSAQQKRALEERCLSTDIVDKSCSREDLNTCGEDARALLDKYEIYHIQKGIYNTWGEIPFPWKVSDLTSGLDFLNTDDKWSVGEYRQTIAYPKGSKVLLIEQNGYEISLYEANEDIESFPGPFNSSKWDKICSVKTTIRTGLPTVEELKQRYKPYTLDLFYKTWGDVQLKWSDKLLEEAKTDCVNLQGSLSDLEKCLKNYGSDSWKETRVKKEFFYRSGDFTLVEEECGDAISIFVALKNIPTSDYIINNYMGHSFSEYMYLSEDDEKRNIKTRVWERSYVLPTGVNKCVNQRDIKQPSEAYREVQIGSLGHYVDVPIPYHLSPSLPTLDKQIEQRPNPTVLTPREILDLDTDTYPYTTECNT